MWVSTAAPAVAVGAATAGWCALRRCGGGRSNNIDLADKLSTDVLKAGGEEAGSMLVKVLQHGLDVLEASLPAAPRRLRREMDEACDSLEAALEALGAQPMMVAASASASQILCDALCQVQKLPGTEHDPSEAVVAVTLALGALAQYRNPLVAAGNQLASKRNSHRFRYVVTI